MKNLFAFAALAVLLIFGSCSKDKDKPTVKSRNVKYEFTGPITGNFTIIYTNATGSLQTVEVQSLPWTKEVTVPNTAGSVSLAISGTAPVGKKSTANIYIGNKVEKTTEATSNSNGVLSIPGLVFIY